MQKNLFSNRSIHLAELPSLSTDMQRLSFSEVRDVYLELFKRHADWDLDFIHSEAQKRLLQLSFSQQT
jgi:hypothetical protein